MGEAADENGSLQNEDGNASAQNVGESGSVQNVNESSSCKMPMAEKMTPVGRNILRHLPTVLTL